MEGRNAGKCGRVEAELFRAEGRRYFGLVRGEPEVMFFVEKWEGERGNGVRTEFPCVAQKLGGSEKIFGGSENFFRGSEFFFGGSEKFLGAFPFFLRAAKVSGRWPEGEKRWLEKNFSFLPYKNKNTKKDRLPNPMRGSGSRPSRLDTIFFTYYLLFVYRVVGGLFVARTAHKYQYVINQCSQRAEGSHYVSVGG